MQIESTVQHIIHNDHKSKISSKTRGSRLDNLRSLCDR